MKEYTYTADVPCHFSIKTTDYSLHKGASYTLPSDNGFIQSLLAQGLLIGPTNQTATANKENTEE